MVEIEHPPLISFSLVIKYQREKKLTFSDMSNLEEGIIQDYKILPRINILSSTGVPVDFRISPITYTSESKKHKLELFDDSVVFTSSEYSNWTQMKSKILKQFDSIKKILGIINITELRLHYIDDFHLDREAFTVSRYFDLSVNVPENVELEYEDFHLGVKLKNNLNENYILKLRGIKPSDEMKYHFRLESFYAKKIELAVDQIGELSTELEDIHDKLDIDFGRVLSAETKKIIGYKE